MGIYIGLVIYIIGIGFLQKYHKISRKFACISITLLEIMICGLRSKYIGFDTFGTYAPSFSTISENSLSYVFQLPDTHYRMPGYVLFIKFLSVFSHNTQYFIFMTGVPFYVSIGYLIYRKAYYLITPFLAVLALNYFTYSLTMVRGMLSIAVIVWAFLAAMEDKWKTVFVLTVIAASFHLAAVIFLIAYPIKKINWTATKAIIILLALIPVQALLPVLFQRFFDAIAAFMPTYRYYGTKGGNLADTLLLIYMLVVIDGIFKRYIDSNLKLRIKKSLVISFVKKKTEVPVLDEYNFYFGMAIVSCVMIAMTSVLDEMIRVGLYTGLGSILLCGYKDPTKKNNLLVTVVTIGTDVLFVIYFLMASVPNMNVFPYLFFWDK